MTPFPRGWQGESGWIVLGFAVLVVLIAAGTVLIIRLNRTAGDRRPPTGQKSADPLSRRPCGGWNSDSPVARSTPTSCGCVVTCYAPGRDEQTP